MSDRGQKRTQLVHLEDPLGVSLLIEYTENELGSTCGLSEVVVNEASFRELAQDVGGDERSRSMSMHLPCGPLEVTIDNNLKDRQVCFVYKEENSKPCKDPDQVSNMPTGPRGTDEEIAIAAEIFVSYMQSNGNDAALAQAFWEDLTQVLGWNPKQSLLRFQLEGE